jgi:predicted O-methyltransferase YrrM
MSQEQWTAVDRYITDLFAPHDPVLEHVLKTSAESGLPAINVAPNQGKLLAVLAMSIGARSILEIGTLGGYSTIWMARTLPSGGKLISLEYDPKHAQVARENITHAGLANVVEIRVGRALDTLPQLVELAPFDMVFIDADKVNNAAYFEWALKLARRGSLIITDNVVRNGEVINAVSGDPNVQGVRRFNEVVASESRVTATEIQTVGSKGYDGLCIAVVNAI